MIPGNDAEFERGILALGQRLTGETHRLDALRRLTGGANMESWRIDYGPHSWVLRRTPPAMHNADSASGDVRTGIAVDAEAAVIIAAAKSGVIAPQVVGSLVPADNLGSGFVMQRLDGETLPHKILGNPDYAEATTRLTRQCAEQLARIHAIPADGLPAGLPGVPTDAMIDTLATRYAETGASIPVFDLALRWLSDNLPEARTPVLLHGDFRMGNLMIDHAGIAGVLDWEQAHFGDPAQDLAYLCMPSWRFGQYDKPVGGFGKIPDLLTHYLDLTGTVIAERDVKFWMAYATLGWGLGTIRFANVWRSGKDTSLERAVVGRRTSETEIDLLLMVEESCDILLPKVSWSLPRPMPPRGETQNAELLDALISWDEDSVMPGCVERDLFEARVARNALRILARDALYGPTFAAQRASRLGELCLTQQQLCHALASGRYSGGILTHLRFDLMERLHIDQPNYAGLKAALARWT